MHHSDSPLENEEIRKMLQKQGEELGLGTTGQFPEGKLSGSDEGEITFAVTDYQGKVVVNFNAPVHWFGMDPAQARVLARSLMSHATRAESEKRGRRH